MLVFGLGIWKKNKIMTMSLLQQKLSVVGRLASLDCQSEVANANNHSQTCQCTKEIAMLIVRSEKPMPKTDAILTAN